MPLAFSGSLSGSIGIVGPLVGNSVSASYPLDVLGSTLYSVYVSAGPSFNTTESIVIGTGAGLYAASASYTTFLGNAAGAGATFAANSVFIGNGAGANSTNAGESVCIGQAAGADAPEASTSVMIGYAAGFFAASASYSVLLGHQAGYDINTGSLSIGSNNIIIGTNVTLEKDRRDSINLGGVIFATGSHFSTNTGAFSGSMPDAKVGIGQTLPQYTLDVNGTVGIATVLHLGESHPLPSGNIGDLAVSASHLWFYNGAWAQLD